MLIVNAPMRSSLVLEAELVLGLALLAGALFARRGHYRLHRYWQSSVVLLNLVLIAAFMLPSFSQSVVPQLPSSLGVRYYAVAVAHGVVGLAVELLGLYVVVAAGTNLLPPHWRFTRYKRWMRSLLVLWWLALLLGAATYDTWYVQTSPSATTQTVPHRRMVVIMKDVRAESAWPAPP